MYKIEIIRKHLLKVTIDNKKDIDLVRRIFNKLLVWSDPPEDEKVDRANRDPKVKEFTFIAYTTAVNLRHMMIMVGFDHDED